MKMIKQIFGCVALGAVLAGSTMAETYYQSTGDPSGSSLTSANYWFTGAAGTGTKDTLSPTGTNSSGVNGNDYVTSVLLRTPLNTTGSYAIYANSLTLNTGATFFLKSQADATFDFKGKLIINGGIISQNCNTNAAGNTQTFKAQAIEIQAGGATILASEGGITNGDRTHKMVINGGLTGGGTLLITSIANDQNYKSALFTLRFTGDNSGYSGNITINNTSVYNYGSTNNPTKVIVGDKDNGIHSNLGTGLITLDRGGYLSLNYADDIAANAGLVIGNGDTKISLLSGEKYNLQSYQAYDNLVYGKGEDKGKSSGIKLFDMSIFERPAYQGFTSITIGGTGADADFIDSRILNGGMFVITNIPEPSTLALLGIGAGLLLALRRKKS